MSGKVQCPQLNNYKINRSIITNITNYWEYVGRTITHNLSTANYTETIGNNTITLVENYNKHLSIRELHSLHKTHDAVVGPVYMHYQI